MTDADNPTGIQTKEVSLYDDDGSVYNDSNPIPVKTVTSVLSTNIGLILTAITGIAATLGLVYAYLQGIDVISYEGGNSMSVNIAYQETYTINLTADNQSGQVGYMLIDLSDTTNFPHTNTNHIVLKSLLVNTNTDAAFVGDLLFGFLSNVDSANGDFNELATLHGDRNANVGNGIFDFSNYGIGLELDEWFGHTTENSTLFQNDVNLYGPDQTTTFPGGDGDFVAWLDSSAGNVDVSITVIYTTSP